MATPCNSASFMESQRAIQPRMLKDFLQDQNLPFPRRRKSAFSVFIHAAVSSAKSPSTLRRSISRRLSRSKRRTTQNRASSRLPEATMTRTTSVTVKDILRWRSFRDLTEDEVKTTSDFTIESPYRCITTTTTSSPRSSWCDSDFTVGDSPVWFRGFSGDIEVTGKKNFYINVAGGDRVALAAATRGPKDVIIHEEEEQSSPISVLDFTLEHEETSSSFHQILANIERRNFMLKQQIQDFENLIEIEDHCLVANESIKLDDDESLRVEERTIQLMNKIKTSSTEEYEANVDDLLLDFFRDELITSRVVKNLDEFDLSILRMAKCWVTGEDDGSLEWELEGAREVSVREMEKRGKWNDFAEDQQQIGIDVAKMVFDHLLNELSMDLLNI